jgi:CheY-like chemotaxis protein
MDRILFLDDDVFQTKYHVDELRTAFRVERRSDVDRAIQDFVAIKEAEGPWSGAVLDIMMPPGKLVAGSPDGMRTGWYVFKELRKLQPGLPVIVITNLGEEEVKDWFRDDTNVKVFDKVLVLPDELLSIARQMFQTPVTSSADTEA